MSHEVISPTEALSILASGSKLLDVRAPVEYQETRFQQTINIPLLSDDERRAVGTTYKQKGKEAAIELGHWFVGGEIKKQRVEEWRQKITRQGILAVYCARGGMRSSIVANWIKESGLDIPRVSGGYKTLRNTFMKINREVPPKLSYLLISGRTGSGKTDLLHALQSDASTLDLENIAKHCGSAFGGIMGIQPTQASFENQIAVRLNALSRKNRVVFTEDESRMIGSCCLPEALITEMRNSPHVEIRASQEERATRVIDQYIIKPLVTIRHARKFQILEDRLLSAVNRISRRLGGVRTQETKRLITDAIISHREYNDASPHKRWIISLLEGYYDPIYDRNLNRYTSKIIKTANYEEALEWCRLQARKHAHIAVDQKRTNNESSSKTRAVQELQTLQEHRTT